MAGEPRDNAPKPAGDWSIVRPIVIAHRSANDLERLRKASELGVDYHECDVWLYGGRMEIRHEKTLGPLPIRWDRWKVEWKGPPRLVLHQLLEACEGQQLLLDLKGRNRELPREVLDAIDEASHEAPFAITTRTWRFLEPFLDMPEVATFPSAGSQRNLRALFDMGRQPWSGIAVHRKLLSTELVERLHGLAPLVTTWPINSIDAYDEVMGYGVDGITSDSMEVLAHALKIREAKYQ